MTFTTRTILAASAIAALLPAAALAQLGAPPSATDYSDAPMTQGSWSYRAVPGGSEAIFMDTGATIRLAFRCSRQTRAVSVSRISAAPAAALSVWTTSLTRTLPAQFEQNAMRVSAVVNAADGLLDAIAFSRGRIAIAMPGFAPLVVPTGPEAARAFEDCRN